MSQNDLSIANADGATVRADMNSALQAIATAQSGSTAPGTTYAGQLWWDTGNNLLKRRNGANTAWITVASFDGTSFNPYSSGSALGTAATKDTGTDPADVPQNSDLGSASTEDTVADGGTIPQSGSIIKTETKIKTSDHGVTSGTLADVPEMNVSVLSGETWVVQFDIFAESSNNTGSNAVFSINGPSASSIHAAAMAARSSGSVGQYAEITAYDGSLGPFGEQNTTAFGRVTATVTFTADGTLTLRLARTGGAGTATCKQGTIMKAWRTA